MAVTSWIGSNFAVLVTILFVAVCVAATLFLAVRTSDS